MSSRIGQRKSGKYAANTRVAIEALGAKRFAARPAARWPRNSYRASPDTRLGQTPLLEIVLVQSQEVADFVLHGDADLARELVAVGAATQQIAAKQVDRPRSPWQVVMPAFQQVPPHEQAEQ